MQTKHLNADKMQTYFIFTIRYMVKVTISQKRENGGDFTWRGSDCEELVEEVNHTAKFVTDLFSFVVVTRIFM